jgi:hypothetical protein
MTRTLTIADLTDPRERLFVMAVFELGGPHRGAEAALRAGYAETMEDAADAAAYLLGAPRIAKVITGETKSRFDVAAVAAFNTLLEICADTDAPANARISAAQEILNRSSIGPVPSRSLSVTAHAGGIEEFLDRLDQMEAGERAASDADAALIDVTPGSDEAAISAHQAHSATSTGRRRQR